MIFLLRQSFLMMDGWKPFLICKQERWKHCKNTFLQIFNHHEKHSHKKYTNIKIKFDDYFAYPGPILCWKGTITLSTCQFFKQYFWIQNDIGLLIVVIEELVNAWNAVQQSNCVHCCAKSTLQSDFVFLHFCIFYLLVHILYIVFVIVLQTPYLIRLLVGPFVTFFTPSTHTHTMYELAC